MAGHERTATMLASSMTPQQLDWHLKRTAADGATLQEPCCDVRHHVTPTISFCARIRWRRAWMCVSRPCDRYRFDKQARLTHVEIVPSGNPLGNRGIRRLQYGGIHHTRPVAGGLECDKLAASPQAKITYKRVGIQSTV